MSRPHPLVVTLDEPVRRLSLQGSQSQYEPHGRAEYDRRQHTDTREHLELSDEANTPHVHVGHRVVPPTVEDHARGPPHNDHCQDEPEDQSDYCTKAAVAAFDERHQPKA